MKDAVMVFGGMFMVLSPFLGATIIGSFTNPIYQKLPITKSLYFKHKAKNLKDEIDTYLAAVYGATYIVSLIVIPTCGIIFGLSDIMVIIIFDTWQIVFTIVFFILAVNYVKKTYCQVLNEYQSIKF